MSDSEQNHVKKWVLVVDDERSVRDVLDWALTNAGYKTQFASNSQEAIEILKQEPKRFDFVISDVQMPGNSGIEVLKYVNSMQTPPPTVMITGHSNLNYFQAKTMGAATMLNKPFSIGVLLTALREAEAYKAGA